MKIRLNLPTLGEVFSHDAPLYKIIKVALPAFILISSLTVFAGVRTHISEYLVQYAWYVTLPGYTFAYVLFSLAPDVLNTVLVAYFIRSILKKHFKGTGIVLNIFAIGLIFFLTKYSYNMSQFSAGSVSTEMGKEIEEIDLSEINADYKKEKEDIQAVYNKDKAEVESLYNEQISLLNKRYESQFKPLREKIKEYDKNRHAGNTSWTDKKIKQQNNKITALEQDKLIEADNFLKEKQSKIEDLKANRDLETSALTSDKESDRNNAQSLKEKNNEDKAQANAFLKKEFEKIAGVAIFIVLVLASLKEIIHFRNDIDPLPILGELDFQFDWLQETIALPFVTIQRHLINGVRNAYNKLPELVEPQKEPLEIRDYSEEQKIIPLTHEKHEEPEEDSTFFRRKISASTTAKTGESFIAHEKTKDTHEKYGDSATTKSRKPTHETTEMRTAKQRLKLYKKKLGTHQQKARVQQREKGKVTARTEQAIQNNLAWVEHWEDILNGGEGTRK